MDLDHLIEALEELRAFHGGGVQARVSISCLNQKAVPVSQVYFSADHDQHKNVTAEYVEIESI